MGKFDFLSFRTEKIEEIEEYIDSEYNKKLEEQRKAYNEEKGISFDSSMSYEEIFCNTIFNKNVTKIGKIYDDMEFLEWDLCTDVDIALFMFMGYCDAECCKQPYLANILAKSLFKKEDKEREEYEQIIDNFPFVIEAEEEEEAEIENWCYDYIGELFCWDNISIFDLKKEIKPGHDLARYGFSKTKRIYDQIFSEKIENIFMLENSLGVFLTNIIYCYCRNMEGMDDYNKIRKIVQSIAKIYGIYCRKDFANYIFSYLSYNCFSGAAISDVEKWVDIFVPFINESFIDLLQVSWWWKVKEEKMSAKSSREKYVKIKRKELYNLWRSDYDDRVPYKDLLESFGLCPFEEMDGTSANMLRNLEILFSEQEKLQQRSRKNKNQIREETDILQSKKNDISISDYIKEIIADNYRQAVNNDEKIQLKLTKNKLKRTMIYAVIHCDVVRSGLQFFNSEIYKKIKYPGA